MSNFVQLQKAVIYCSDRIDINSVTLDNYVTTDNLLQNKLGLSRASGLPPQQEGKLPAYNAKNILVANIRPYLKKIWFADKGGGCSADVLVFSVKDEFDSKFVYYAMFRDDFFSHVMKGSKGTKMPRGDKTQILDFTVPLFDKQKQQKIVAVLSALDAKIELNNRINTELEAMAKILYDFWFVQFDFPNQNGKPYKSSGGKMVYNETLKREIPEGWNDDNILAIADLLGGGTPSKNKPEYWNGEIPFFTPTDADLHVFKISTEEFITVDGLKSCSSKLFGKGTVFITARGSVGKLMIAANDMAMNQSCYALKAREGVGNAYLYYATIGLIHYLKVKSSGSVFNSIVSNDIKYTILVIPHLAVVREFSQKIEPVFEKILLNTKENQQLTQLRDWLLPMLMNGQVTVK